jgi:hypothetical protein
MGNCFSGFSDDNYEVKQSMQEVMQIVRTGDIVLFSGAGWSSSLIRSASPTGCIWSHIGIVIRIENNKPMLLESTIDEYPTDKLSNSEKSGVKLVCLEDKISSYGGLAIAYRRLHIPTSSPLLISRSTKQDVRRRWTRKLIDYGRANNYKNYEDNPVELFGSLLRSNSGNHEDTMFCVELVARCLIIMGLLDKDDYSTNNYTLEDFSSTGDLRILNGVYFGTEKLII